MCSRLEITAGFWLLLAAARYLMDGTVVLLTVPAVILHELAHYAALRLCGAKINRVRCTAFGAEMRVENPMALSYGQEIFCAAAGPVCNIACAVCCSFWGKDSDVLTLWAGIHGVQAVFNLLPFEASDGGRILRAALCTWLGVARGERAAVITGRICCAAVLGLSLWIMLKTGGNGFLLLGAVGLMLPARKRYL